MYIYLRNTNLILLHAIGNITVILLIPFISGMRFVHPSFPDCRNMIIDLKETIRSE